MLSATLYRFVGKVKVCAGGVSALAWPHVEMEQQRTWNHIPQRNCMWEKIKKEEAVLSPKKKKSLSFFLW